MTTQPTVAPNSPEAELVSRVRGKYRALAGAVVDFVKRAIEFGEFLNEERAKFKHGKWIEWLESQCGLPRSTAHRCHKIADPANKAKIETAMSKLPDPAGLSLNKAVALITNGSSSRSPRGPLEYDDYQSKLIEKLKDMKLDTAKEVVNKTKSKLDEELKAKQRAIE